MDENTRKSGISGTATRIAIAGGIAGLGLAVGGIAIATAGEDATSASSQGGSATVGATARGGDRGFGGRGFGDDLAPELAEALGVEESEVEQALSDVRDELTPERPEDGVPPTEEQLEAWRSEFATALAEALGVEVAEVETALEEIRAAWEAEAEERFAELREQLRPSLVEELDAAVADGTLTAADKRSVLKAYDAGVIGGGHHGFGPGGFGPGGFGGPRGFDGVPDDGSATPDDGATAES